MTQSSPNSTSPISGDLNNSSSTISVTNNGQESLVETNTSTQLFSPTTKSESWWQKVIGKWNNVPIRAKIAAISILCAAVPVIAVTQGIVSVARKNAVDNLQEVLELDLEILEDEISSQKKILETNASTIAALVETANINPERTTSNSSEYQNLQSLLNKSREQLPNASFLIVTDAQGRVVVDSVKMIKDDFSAFPLLPQEEKVQPEFESVDIPDGVFLSDVPIVAQTLNLNRPLSGFELLSENAIARLGLSEQASIGLREQQIEGLAEQKKPYPEDTFDIDGGKAGFTIMATHPIQLNGQKVGTAIVGNLVNRNFTLVDRLKDVTGVSTATIFAQDWRVSTNVPYTDNETRAIGTRVSREVADIVLNKEEVFLGEANIIGIEYLTGYSPIYNHRRKINESDAKPVGIAYVGEPINQVEKDLQQITLIGYAIGGVVLLVFIIILLLPGSDAGISDQLRRLTEFAKKLASGNSDARLETTERKDEIGVLSRSLNEMAGNIDENLKTRQQEVVQQREQKEKLEQEIYQLLEEVEGALDGDLTVRASLSSMEMSTVADLFNAIIDNLRDIAVEVKESSTKVNSSLLKNEQSIKKLAQQAIEEAEETRKTLDSIEQMSISIEDVASNANQAAFLANDAYQETQKGAIAMDKTVNSIVDLRTTVGETAKKMKRLGESSQKISQVVSLIKEIALKTNLLAINASVEASRAGEQGEGFTIVAEQVGALAEQVTNATKEISQIVTAIQLETQEVTQAMELGTSQVVNSTRLVESTRERLESVLDRSQSINELMQSISKATVSQTDTSRVVTELMQQMALQTQEQLISSESVSQSMQATAQVAQKLESAVEQFKVNS